jgi:hypothetical protein
MFPEFIKLSEATGHLVTAFLGTPEVKKAIDDLANWLGGIAKGIDGKTLAGTTSGFKDAEQKAAKLSDFLNEHRTLLTHGRHLSREQLSDKGMNVVSIGQLDYTIDTMTPVPLTASFWLLLSGLVCIAIASRICSLRAWSL